MRHRIEFILFQLLKWLALMLPLKSAQRLGAALGAGAYHLIGGRRRVALDNLRYAFPDKTEAERVAIAKGAFRNYGITFVELLWFPNLKRGGIEHLFNSKTIDVLLHAVERGKGLILLMGHFGNWELTALSTGVLLGKPIYYLAQTQNNELVDDVINKHRSLFGNMKIPMGMSVREVIRVLGQYEVIAIAGDQSAAMESAYVNFFGRNVATHKGPAVFALKCNAPIVISVLVRQPDFRYEAIFKEVPTNDLPADRDAAVEELTRRHTEMLEQFIRQNPDHWLWMHRRWKHVEE
ncbi:MAG: lysophospholipid acyltransferase family protein [Ignavibacteriales bacterium]|nr:lysophospholipid acyltransferase family protein [Ignavibacteriales bacterium]